MTSIAQLLFSAVAAANAQAASTALTTEDCEFSETYAFNGVECQFEFRNQGDKAIHVSDFQPVKPGDKVEPGELTIAPHTHAYARAVMDTGNDVGHARHIFRFRSDEPGHEERVVVARGFVMTALDERPKFDFGVVDLAQPQTEKTIEFASHDVADFRATKILEAPAYLDAKLAPGGRSITLKIRPDAQWGFHVDQVKLATNSSAQKEVWVGIQADIHGVVVPASNPLDMGLLRTGNLNEQKIRLTSTNGKDFAVGKVELEGFKGETKVIPCEPAATGCRLVRLVISDDQPLGSVKGKMWVELPDYKQRLPIALWALLVSKETKIDKLDGDKIIEAQKSRNSASVASTNDISLNNAIKSAVQAANEPDPPGKGPLLKWSVGNEQLVHGYQIFRADAGDGPFLLVNKNSIVAKRAGSDSAYQYRDNTAASGKTYWYYIGILYNDGHKQQLTGPQKVTAK